MTDVAPASLATLRRLAAFHGVLPSYVGLGGRRVRAAPEALLAVLRALGVPVRRVDDAPEALRLARLERLRLLADPVAVVPEGGTPRVEVRWPARAGRLAWRLDLEDGGSRRGTASPADLRAPRVEAVGPDRCVTGLLGLGAALPFGYHRLELEAGQAVASVLVVAAPRRAPEPRGRPWGLFAPVYALRSRRGLGAGDLADLRDLLDRVRTVGGNVVGTLPLLAAFLDEPFETFEPSPYAPASRLFWSEFHAALDRGPDLEPEAAAAALLRAPRVRREASRLRALPLVDHRASSALRRGILEARARAFFASGGERDARFRRFLGDRPDARDYARFCAVLTRRREPWRRWPEADRVGGLAARDGDPALERFHLHAQWLVGEQVRALAARARAAGPGLYLDFPLGVHADGYDTFRERRAFAVDVSVGAPPDSFFPQGQDWGFPPLLPRAASAAGHRYLRACLRHHLAAAGFLRLDHVMGLHRLFWIPRGFPKSAGVYVRSPAAELEAIVCLEASRAGAVVVGENLGTVPRAVDRALIRHGWLSSWVAEYAATPRAVAALPPVPRACVASVETHDMPPFAAYWRGEDVPERVALGLFPASRAGAARRARAAACRALAAYLRRRGLLRGRATARSVLDALHAHLAGSAAALVLVNTEDLWLERRPQNVPGTWRERPNWRRKFARTIEDLDPARPLGRALARIARARRAGPPVR